MCDDETLERARKKLKLMEKERTEALIATMHVELKEAESRLAASEEGVREFHIVWANMDAYEDAAVERIRCSGPHLQGGRYIDIKGPIWQATLDSGDVLVRGYGTWANEYHEVKEDTCIYYLYTSDARAKLVVADTWEAKMCPEGAPGRCIKIPNVTEWGGDEKTQENLGLLWLAHDIMGAHLLLRLLYRILRLSRVPTHPRLPDRYEAVQVLEEMNLPSHVSAAKTVVYTRHDDYPDGTAIMAQMFPDHAQQWS